MEQGGMVDTLTTILQAQRDRLEDVERADRVQPKAHVKAAISAAYTLTAFDFVVPVDTSDGDVVVSLPAAASALDAIYILIRTGAANQIRTLPAGVETINAIVGPATYATVNQWDWLVLISNNVNGWYGVRLTA